MELNLSELRLKSPGPDVSFESGVRLWITSELLGAIEAIEKSRAY
jgi:hypothetical protein